MKIFCQKGKKDALLRKVSYEDESHARVTLCFISVAVKKYPDENNKRHIDKRICSKFKKAVRHSREIKTMRT